MDYKFPRNTVPKNMKVLQAVQDESGRNIKEALDALIGQAGKVVLEVADVKALTSQQCEDLKCGDQVIKNDSAGKHGYVVSYKKSNEMCLVYCDHQNIEEVYYEKSGTWSYIQTDNTHLTKLVVSNVTQLTDSQINSLQCGDIILKKDNSGKHIYIVTYKKDETGICLTYFDATYVETVSYDYTNGHWVYNSMDATELRVLPSTRSLDDSKTYALKYVSGTLSWVEEE